MHPQTDRFQVLCDYLKKFFSFDQASLLDAESSCKVKQLFTKQDTQGNTLLILMAKGQDVQLIKTLMSLLDILQKPDQNEILLQRSHIGKCAYHYAAENWDNEIFVEVKKVYDNSIETVEIYQISTRDTTCFYLEFIEKEELETSSQIEAFANYYSNLFSNTIEKKKLIDLFEAFGENGRTAFMQAVVSENQNIFNAIFVLSRKLFDKKTRENFLLQTNHAGETAFHISLRTGKIQTLKGVMTAYRELLGDVAVKKLLEIEINGEISVFNVLKNIEEFVELFIDLLTSLYVYHETELQTLILKCNKNGNTFVEQLQQSHDPDFVEEMLIVLRDDFPQIHQFKIY